MSSTRFGGAADTALGLIASIVLFAMMMLTFVDVIMRYVFNAPLSGSFEITEALMAVLIFAGLPLVSRREEHVTIDSIDQLLPTPVRRGFRFVIQLGCGAALAGMAWLLWQKAGSLARYGDTTATLKITIAPFVYLMSALTLATALVHFFKAFTPPPPPHSEVTI